MTQFDRFERELAARPARRRAGRHCPTTSPTSSGGPPARGSDPPGPPSKGGSPWTSQPRGRSTARIPWRPIMARRAARAARSSRSLAVYAGAQRRVRPPFGPADNGLIPYDADGDIFVGDPVTGTTRLIVGGPENDYEPTFSPDGSHDRLRPRRARSGEDIVIVDERDGGDLQKITPEPPAGAFADARWTPGQRRRCSSGTTSTASSVLRCSMPPAEAPRHGCSEGLSRRLGALPAADRQRGPRPRKARRRLGPLRDGARRHEHPPARRRRRSDRHSRTRTSTSPRTRPMGRRSTTTATRPRPTRSRPGS